MISSALRRLLAIDDPPERTALAFSIGVFIAFSPFLGLHTILATVIALSFRFNKIAIYVGTFINNPLFTLVPIIFASYAIGAYLIGKPLGLSEEKLALLRDPRLLDGGYWRTLFRESWDVLLPFSIGGTVLSVIGSAIAYPVTLRFLRMRGRRKERKAQDKAENIAP
jgi:uncharacterized protein (DUF2062 family)